MSDTKPINTGGSAFPTASNLTDGMTLRTYIATKAMAAMIPTVLNTGSTDTEAIERLARNMPKIACEFADMLLAELEKP